MSKFQSHNEFTLSAIVITKNEARNIKRCLRSLVNWVDEIIILDSGSTDNTVAICQQFTSQVYITDWPGYGPQKNRALQLAKSHWILSIDADEWVSPKLNGEISRAIRKLQIQGYYIPRLNMFCGHFQRYGDAAHDKVLRLFQKHAGKFSEDIVHEKLICSGKTAILKNRLFHNSYRTRYEWAQQMQKYAEMSALLRYKQGKKSYLWKALLNSAWIFFRSYILRQGFRDGATGLLFACLNAKSSFQKNIMVWRLNQSDTTAKQLTLRDRYLKGGESQ